MVPSAYPKSVGVPECESFAAEYPARTFPCQRFDVVLTNKLRMTRGQCTSLIFHCMTLSFTAPRRFNRRPRALPSPTMCRFIPALSVTDLVLERAESAMWQHLTPGQLKALGISLLHRG